MTAYFWIRTAALLVPTALALAIISRPRTRLWKTGALLALLWNVSSLLAVNVVALHAGWWSFDVSGGTFIGVPFDLLLGWALLWGPCVFMLAEGTSLPVAVLTAVLIDIVLMPSCKPVVLLRSSWLSGELLAIVTGLIPGLLLGRWTTRGQHAGRRNVMQMIIFSSVFLLIIPLGVLQATGSTYTWSDRDLILIQLLAIPALLGISALQEFATRGHGTPLPFDPPLRLVTSGPYSYVRNPMQLSMTALLLGEGVLLRNAWLAVGAVVSVVYSAGLGYWDETSDLASRFPGWTAYRDSVRLWLPRWRPHVTEEARLYIAEGCNQCQDVRRWLERRKARGIRIVPAEGHPSRDLRRITYDPADGTGEVEGVVAMARALEHIHLGWAFCGFAMRLPIVAPFLQIVIDACGGGPRLVKRAEVPGVSS